MNSYKLAKPPHILLVEDNAGDVLLVKECFRETGKPYCLSVASDGQEAMDFLNRKAKYEDALRPDLILLDLNLPRVSGHDVLAYVKGSAEFQQIPVLVLSTSKASKDIQKAYALAANCYLCKPATLEELRHLIRIIHEFWLELVWFSQDAAIVSAR